MNPDPAIDSFVTRTRLPGAAQERTLWLHTSPEFPMKRLLAAGSGPIYQLGKVFRRDESGRQHNPEFTMLEWYRPGFDMRQLMDEVAELVGFVSPVQVGCPDIRIRSYQEVFLDVLAIDPLTATVEQLAACARRHAIRVDTELEKDDWLGLLMTHLVEPALATDRLEFIHDYPATQAALARVRRGEAVADRFELFLAGMELANGYFELNDAQEQRQRFDMEEDKRRRQGKMTGPLDENLILALQHGLPDCSGVALGVDRLLMAILKLKHIDEVLAFPVLKA